MKKTALLLIAALFVLTGCGAPAVKTTEPEKTGDHDLTCVYTEPAVTAETVTTEEPAPVTISPLAKPWVMQPEDQFSWVREEAPEFIVLHFSSNAIADPENPCDATAVRKIFMDNEVSANYLVDRDGTVWCLIPEDRCAWHAGAGTFRGEERLVNKMNLYSFGIEMVAVGSKNDMAQYLTPAEYARVPADCIGFTEAQYASVRALVADLCERYGIPCDIEHVIGHQEYSPSKNDPGELFDWSKIL